MKLRRTPFASSRGRQVPVSRQRFNERRRARRRQLLRRALLTLAAVALVLGAFWVVFFSSLLTVREAEVRGVDVLSQEEVEAAAEVPEDVPLARVDLAAIQARVEDLAPVRSAEVSRSWPHAVRIDVTEREVVAFVRWDEGWRGLDDAGVLFRDYDEKPTGLPEIRVKSNTPVEALVEAAAVVNALGTDLVDRVSYLEVQTIDDITLVLKNGATVTWGSADQSSDKAAVLDVLLRQDASAYDVTAPGRPTIRR